MHRLFALLAAGILSASAGAQTSGEAPSAPETAPTAAQSSPSTPDAPATPTPALPTPSAPVVHSDAGSNQAAFNQYRRDLINLLALRADPEPLVAAAQLAYYDKDDPKRTAKLKSPSLLERAQKTGADTPLVWWVSALLDCGTTCPRKDDVQKLQALAPDNAVVWFLALGGEKDPAKARPLLASMAQSKRFDDYWSANVLVLYHALETLPVPPDVIAHGVSSSAARLNFATSVASAILPPYPALIRACNVKGDNDLVADCLSIARLLESGGSFGTQAVGFDIEEALLDPGVQRDVMHARRRAIAWQVERFNETSVRFAREPELVKTYLGFLKTESGPSAAAQALLRSQNVPSDPPQDWKPADPLK
ncbi:MAG TPA: hypothetical protein VF132_13360 [Rudaea sp.]